MGGRSPARRGAWGEAGGGGLTLPFFFFLASRLLPGAGGRSPARRGAWGERGRRPSTPPAPPYSPLGGNAKIVSLMGLYPARRVSRGASARTFPGLWPGRCPRLLWRSVRPAGVRDRLRARAIAASAARAGRGEPAGRLPQRENNGRTPAGQYGGGKPTRGGLCVLLFSGSRS